MKPKVASKYDDTFAVVWEANVNDPNAATFNAFAKIFDTISAPTLVQKNDHRIDMASRGARVPLPVVARSAVPDKYVYFWRDDRFGRENVFGRLMSTIPPN